MSEYMFGVSHHRPTIHGKRPATIRRKLQDIAELHGCTFIEANIPGTGYQRWFAAPNRGNPFDQQLSDRVYEDMKKAGIE